MAKQRGRRTSKKEKKSDDLKIYGGEGGVEQEFSENTPSTTTPTSTEPAPNTFFGLVDTTELDYFKQAESTLNANAFESPEDRAAFVTSVLEEAKGKELKLVTNQICSKLVERLILHATDEQLKTIFKAFNNHFVSLIHHKYASHCVETLLVRSASLIEKELLNPFPQTTDDTEEFVSMENLFLFFLNEVRPYLKDMIAQQYASHTLRLIILIIAGKELPSTTMSNSTVRSKKSKIARKMIEISDNEDFSRAFQVPSSFKDELKQLIDTLKTLDRKQAREFAIEKVASPVLQLLIQVEGIVDRDRPIWHLIFLRDDEEKDSQEEAFVEYLLSDAVGSHFLEHTIKDQRLKYVEKLYRNYMSTRVLKLARRDTTGSYVIQALLKKLKQNEVREMLDQLIPEMSILMTTNLEMGQSIIDASAQHRDYKRDAIIEEMVKKYTPKENESDILESVLQLAGSTLGNTKDDWPTAEERRRALFLEKLITFDKRFLELTVDNLLSLPQERLIQMCFHGVFSHVVENALIPDLDIIKRRRLLNALVPSVVDLSCNAYGSHIVDKLWPFTIKLNNYKERIARELVGQKEKVKESTYGRLVWKNWKMELFVRKRHDWNFAIKAEEFEKFPPKKIEEKTELGTNSKREFNKDDKKRKHDEKEDDKTGKKQKVRGRNRK